MATVPQDDIPTQQAEPLPGRAYPRVDDSVPATAFGSGVGSALETTGERIDQSQKVAADKAQREADQVRVTQANTQLSSFVTDAQYGPVDPATGQRDPSKGAYSQHGDKAIGLDGQYMPAFNDKAEEINGSLANNSQKAAFAVYRAHQQEELGLGLARYENEEFQRVRGQTYDAAAQQQITQASLNWRGMADAKTYQATKDSITATGQDMADVKKLDRKETQGAMVDSMLSNVTRNALSDHGLGFASNFLEQHKDELSNPDLYHQLHNEIDAEQKKADADRIDGLRGKFNDALQGSLHGVPGSGNMFSQQDARDLFKHEWAQKYDLLRKAGVVGSAEKNFDKMDGPQIQTFLDANDPSKQPAHLGMANDFELFQGLRAAADRSNANRNADPRGFAVKTYGDAPVDWSQPPDKAADTLNNRAATAADDSRRLGVSMTLLSKPEVKQLSDSLARQSPGQQLGTLTTLRDKLDNEATFKQAVEELRPADSVMAEAALRMPRDPAKAPLWFNAKYDNDPQTSLEMLAGNAMLNPTGPEKAGEGKGGFPKGVAMPPEQDLRRQFNANMPKGLVFGNPDAADHSYAGFRALYAAKIAHDGDTSGTVNTTAARAAAEQLTPHVDTHFGGMPVAVPPGMDPAVFPDRVRDAISATLKSKGIPPDWLRGHALMQEGRLGSGDYAVMDSTGHNLAVYPGTNQTVRIHLDQQYARPGSMTSKARATKRDFPAPTATRDVDADTPDTPTDQVVPADFEPAGFDR